MVLVNARMKGGCGRSNLVKPSGTKLKKQRNWSCCGGLLPKSLIFVNRFTNLRFNNQYSPKSPCSSLGYKNKPISSSAAFRSTAAAFNYAGIRISHLMAWTNVPDMLMSSFDILFLNRRERLCLSIFEGNLDTISHIFSNPVSLINSI